MKPLTDQEHRVMKLTALGHSNKSTADLLGIDIKTVEKHRQSVYYKWSVNSTVAMIRVGLRLGEISLDSFLNSDIGEGSRHERPMHLSPPAICSKQ